ncbi:hypothetical protein ACMD2_25556 [Ananas comosus]|uniref:Histone chaperone domain-containing protein n=2 Tax=Ananas comosus TaxID=4615 RepID=A0A199VX85_ANACO|nr:hypothetical protein ACMD2_25556 [Ananas comosus]CAD1832727.1 unnamed protein product [Ananas comosus var. bracteatus]
MEEGAKKAKGEAEEEIARAMRARVSHFKEQADSLTLEGVRRILEKDLGKEAFSLDVHKRFIKKCLDECFYGAEDEKLSETSGKVKATAAQTVKEGSEALQLKTDSSGLEEKIDGSSALDGNVPAEHESGNSQAAEFHGLNEDVVKKALKKRTTYIRDNLERITLQEVRRILEDDLKLKKKALDAYKSFISKELDELIQSCEGVVESTNGVKKSSKKCSQNVDEEDTSKGRKRVHQESDSSDVDDTHSADEELDNEKRLKKEAQKIKVSTKGIKRQKPAEKDLDRSLEEDGRNSSEDGHSHSSTEEKVKNKREKATQVYGKQVEHLKLIIKSCGMSVPPSVYKRVKQAPESKREEYLIKELEEMLEKEGLSSNPTEKEIKAVKKRKERARELEGIDLSNIVTSSRRRSSINYIPLPKPRIEVESDDDEEEEDEDEDEDDEDGDDNEKDTDNGGNNGGDSSEGMLWC